jgi:archaellin
MVLVAVVLAAGCVNQTQIVNQTSPPTTISTTPPVTTTVSIMETVTVCPTPADGSYWIIINPISEVKKGNTPFTINGTTNLATSPSGNVRLKIVTYPTKLDPRRQWGEHSVEDYGSVFTAIADIQKGDGCINTFSAVSPGLNANPGEYFVTVSKLGSSRGDPEYAENQTIFNII